MSEPFDFDYWANLAKTDPANFDKKKEEFLLQQIEAMNSNNKDSLVALAKELSKPTTGTALEKAASANAIMMESLQSLQQGLIHLRAQIDPYVENATTKYTTWKK